MFTIVWTKFILNLLLIHWDCSLQNFLLKQEWLVTKLIFIYFGAIFQKVFKLIELKEFSFGSSEFGVKFDMNYQVCSQKDSAMFKKLFLNQQNWAKLKEFMCIDTIFWRKSDFLLLHKLSKIKREIKKFFNIVIRRVE